jgi:hypothetical protein
MKTLETWEHAVASHCETGTTRNLLVHAGLRVTEPMIFGIGSGPTFYYLFFAKGPSTFPLLGIRNRPGSILANVCKLAGVRLHAKRFRTTDEAQARADALIDAGVPVAISVDMFYMKYMPAFMQIHAPFHFVVLVGREDGSYAVSDPYHEGIGILSSEDLRAGWETHAPFGQDNFLAHVESVPGEVDWKSVVKKAVRRTCRDMLLPPVVRNVFSFVGVEGIRTYGRSVRDWKRRYRGIVLREGILFEATAFEAQGTGGGAFRLMYGAFLQEVAGLYGSRELDELADRMVENGRCWREVSRRLVALGKKLPKDDGTYEEWLTGNGSALDEGLDEISRSVLKRADFEEGFFRDLRKAIDRA